LALNLTGDQQDAEDVLQETLLKAYTDLDLVHGASRFYGWLVRIGVNEALMRLRKRSSEKNTVSLEEPVEVEEKSPVLREIEDWADDPEKRYAKMELGKILNQTVQRLEPQFRIVVIWRQ